MEELLLEIAIIKYCMYRMDFKTNRVRKGKGNGIFFVEELMILLGKGFVFAIEGRVYSLRIRRYYHHEYH